MRARTTCQAATPAGKKLDRANCQKVFPARNARAHGSGAARVVRANRKNTAAGHAGMKAARSES